MEEIRDVNELKSIAAGILRYFDTFCKDNNIKYSIGYGTMLGAVRHGGFIPWDDDIDVIMSRDDFNKLLSICNKMESQYSFISIQNCSDFMAPLAKIIDNRTILIQKLHIGERVRLGVYIDVFVYDKIPDNKVLKELLYKTLFVLQKAWSFCENSASPNSNLLIRCVRRLINRTKMARCFGIAMNCLASKKRNSTTYSNLMYSVYNRNKEEISEIDLCNISDYEFEGFSVYGVRNYDLYLEKLYGDYMKLPPEDKRVTHHSYVAYYQ